ncbi:MAG: ABC transporter ATP-binding protein [Conexivisphaerales archaeon]
MLEVVELKSGYNGTEVLHGINLSMNDGEFISVIGPNGAGKSTLLKTISGFIRPYSGKVVFNGKEISGLRIREILSMGIEYVPQGAGVFSQMSIYENLEMGGFFLNDKAQVRKNLEKVFEIFPFLKDRQRAKAGFLSGGERAMLAIGRALVGNPRLMLLDEPTTGLDIGKQSILIDKLKELKNDGVNFLLVEQNLKTALELCDKAYVISAGIIKYSGQKEALQDKKLISSLFFGTNQ